jgi:WD40 repeat protein
MEAGESIGLYRVVRTLGRGAAGITYEAERAGDARRVALKVMRLSRVEDWKVVELFEREARVLAHVVHPAVPAYVDHFTFEGDDGQSFCIVQELAPGPSLGARVAGGFRLDEAGARRFAESLLDVLDYLHRRSPPVIHRDIKPENVILDDGGKVWLVDFGSVRDVYKTTAGGSTVAGTFGYMAPEQLRGVARPESDLYGLGATLVYALTGRSPADLPQHKLRIAFRPAARVSPGFAAWLDRLLEPAPEDRFTSAAQALHALRHPARRPFVLGANARIPPRTALLAGVLGTLSLAAAAVVGPQWAHTAPHAVRAAKAGQGDLPQRPADWRFAAFRRLRTIPAHFNPVSAASFSPDGARLFTSGFDGTVKIWDPRTGQPMGALAGHNQRVGGVHIFADGALAVTGGDHTIRVWHLPDGRALRTIDAESPQVFAVDVSPDGKSIVAGLAGLARVFSLEGAPLASLPHGGQRVLSVAFSPDGSRIVTGGDDGTVKIWLAADGSLGRTLQGHTGAVDRVAVAPDGQLLASASDDHTVKLWHMFSGSLLKTLQLHGDEVWSVGFAPDDGMLLTGGKDGVLGVWSLPTSVLRQELSLRVPVTSIDFGPAGMFATGHSDGTLVLWELAGGGHRATLPAAQIVDDPPPAPAPSEAGAYAAAMAVIDRFSGDRSLYDEAEQRLIAIRDANPRSALAYAGLGRVAFRRGYRSARDYDPLALDSAAALANQAIALDPGLPDGYCVRGWVELQKRDGVAARADLARTLKLAPTMPRALFLSVELALDADDIDGAEATLRAMLGRPLTKITAADVYDKMGDVFARAGDGAAAEEVRRRQIDLQPESAGAKGNLAWLLVQKGDYAAAIAMAKRALSQKDYVGARNTLADAYCLEAEQALWDRRDPDEAARLLDDASRVGRPLWRIAYDLGALHAFRASLRGDRAEHDQAREWFTRAADLDPNDTLARAARDRL